MDDSIETQEKWSEVLSNSNKLTDNEFESLIEFSILSLKKVDDIPSKGNLIRD